MVACETGLVVNMSEPKLSLVVPSLWEHEDQRPRCPNCEMRMIVVRDPPPAKHECLRCSHTELVEGN